MADVVSPGMWGQFKKSLVSVLMIISKFGLKLLTVIGKMVKLAKVGLAVASFASYTYLYSWKFALVIMLLLLVHESGHVWAMRRWGVPTKGFYFIPFLGGAAVATARAPSRWAEVYIALMGPIWGGLLALGAAIVYWRTNVALWAAIAAWMAMVNLFNMLPINPLDGGRVFRAMFFSIHRWAGLVFLFVGMAAFIVICFYIHIGFLVCFLFVVGLAELISEYRYITKTYRMKKEIQELKDRMIDGFTIQGALDRPESKSLLERNEELQNSLFLPADMRWFTNILAFGWYIAVGASLFFLMSSMNHIPGAALAMQVLSDK